MGAHYTLAISYFVRELLYIKKNKKTVCQAKLSEHNLIRVYNNYSIITIVIKCTISHINIIMWTCTCTLDLCKQNKLAKHC